MTFEQQLDVEPTAEILDKIAEVLFEASANVAKYAEASSVSVRVGRENGRAVVEVVDDGVGGANPRLGSGLHGLNDRVEALEGRLRIESPRGEGTTIRAEIPCG